MTERAPWHFLLISPAERLALADELRGADVLGIEVTDPVLASHCTLGNIDPQHSDDRAAHAPAAIEAAVSHEPLPKPGAVLVTIRPDADSLGAMAILWLRHEGMVISGDMMRRIRAIARMDRHDMGPWPGRKPMPDTVEEVQQLLPPADVSAVAALARDEKKPLEERVFLLREWLRTGMVPGPYAEAVLNRARALLKAWKKGEIAVRPAANGQVAVVESATPGALHFGYLMAPVVVAHNPQHAFGNGDAGSKYTIAQWREGYADLTALARDLSEREAGWGGAATIIGSPQHAPSRLSPEEVAQALERHLISAREGDVRRVLLASIGITPQVVTETLWALLNPHKQSDVVHDGIKPFVPDVVHVVTTTVGRERIEDLQLQARIETLMKAHGWPAPAFKLDVPAVADGELEDIRTRKDNYAFANHMARLIREYTRDENTIVHVSLAGGRKTMSSYDLAIMTLLGRAKDRVSHVLVNPPELENNPYFWWPGQLEKEIEDRQGNKHPTDENSVQIDLVDTPFVPMRLFLSEEELRQLTKYEDMVRQVRQTLAASRVIVDLETCVLRIGTHETRLEPRLMALYALVAEFALEDRSMKISDLLWPKSETFRRYRDLYKSISGKDLELLSDIQKEYSNLRSSGMNDEEIKNNIDIDFRSSFSEMWSKLIRGIGFSNSAAMQAFIPQRKKEGRRYEYCSLNLQPWQIEIKYK